MTVLADSLAAFNARCFDAFGRLTYEQGLPVGVYSVFFDGWHAQEDSTVLHGRWFAWPQRIALPKRFFVAQVVADDSRRLVQEYKLGQPFELGSSVHLEFLLDPRTQLFLLAWALDAKDALVSHVQANG